MFNEQILQGLVDRAEITELLSRQGLWLDERDYEKTLEIFTPDVVGHTPGGEVHGADALAKHALERHDEYEYTQHATTNHIIELDGNTAVLRANVIAVFKLDDDKSMVVVTARYRFDVRRTEDGWRFSSITVEPTSRTAAIDRAL